MRLFPPWMAQDDTGASEATREGGWESGDLLDQVDTLFLCY